MNEKEKMNRSVWLVTGAAGFIGSHLVEQLLEDGHSVVGLDNFATGKRENIEFLQSLSGDFRFAEGDIRNPEDCSQALKGVDFVLHNAALGSVPRSINSPWESHDVNVNGFVRMLIAARDAGVRRFVYASSSSVYGDSPDLPKKEDKIGRALSPYASTKQANEIYAESFSKVYGMKCVGLRYFNVFGLRQDPNGPYAAVIPKWIQALEELKSPEIFGDGKTSRDFTYVKNVVQANLKAATTELEQAHRVFNIGCGGQATLLELFAGLRGAIAITKPEVAKLEPVFKDFRSGDIRHSHAETERAREELGYIPKFTLEAGLKDFVKAV